jgi:carboxypeptidase Taq
MATLSNPAAAPLRSLRDRLAELSDLEGLGRLAAWDQRTMMPMEGGPARGEQLATLERLAHERATAPEIGEWLGALEGANGLDPIDRDVVRLARRDWDRAVRVPHELAGELERAASNGQVVWEQARAEGDFAAYTPALERNVELAREYAACFDGYAHPYDALLADYDHGLTCHRVGEVFAELAEQLPPLVEQAPPGPAPVSAGVDVQRRAVEHVLARLGVEPGSWRIDVAAHPFSIGIGPRDSRVTTRYDEHDMFAVIAALHEFGHALYERQIAPELARTNLGRGTSMSVHESQSKLWENHVGRHRAFAPVLARQLGLDAGALHADLVAVRPSCIRVSADQVTYPLHIVLRFELERALIEGTLAVADLPAAWIDGMRRLLGVEVPDMASGVLQDPHWAAGAFGYFPSYALGCLIAAQLWEALEAAIGPQDEALGRIELGPVRDWLREHVHVHGRRLDTEPLVERATGRGVEPGPFIRHVSAIVLSSART